MIVFAPLAPSLVRRFGTRAISTAGMLAVTAALLGLATLQQGTAIWQFEVILFVFGAGMSHVLPPTTAQIVATLPEDEAGTSSAVNNTFRQVGGSIGIAVLGSVLGSLYRGRINPYLGALPAPLRALAASSITATLQILHAAGARGQGFIPLAQGAFMHAMHVTWFVAAAVVFAGTMIVYVGFPNRRTGG